MAAQGLMAGVAEFLAENQHLPMHRRHFAPRPGRTPSGSIVPRPPICCHDSGATSFRTKAANSAAAALSPPVRSATVYRTVRSASRYSAGEVTNT